MSLATRNEVWDALPPVRSGEDARSTSTSTRPPSASSWPASSRGTSTTGPRSCPGWGSAPTRSGWSAARRPSTPRTGALVPLLRLGGRGAGRDVHPLRQPPSRQVRVLLPPVRRGHVPADPRRDRRRQDRPGDGGRQPAGLRHPHRPLLRPGPRHPPERRPVPAPPRHRPPLPARAADVLHGRARRGRPRGGAAAVLRTATTTPRRWCGSGGRRSCGAGSPSPCAACWPTTSAPPPDAWARWRACSTPRSPSTSCAAPSTSTPWSASTARRRPRASPRPRPRSPRPVLAALVAAGRHRRAGHRPTGPRRRPGPGAGVRRPGRHPARSAPPAAPTTPTGP